MKPNTQPRDEFFPEVIEAGPVQSEHLTVLQRVVPKAEFATYAGALTDALLEEQSAIEAYVRIRNVSDILDQALGRIKDRAINSMHGTSEDICGAKVQVKSLPKRYEYQDSVVDDLEFQKKAIEEKLKARKKFLENLPADVADTGTGEIIHPAKFVSGGSTLQITF
ncbi:MAG: hypothetical protein NTU47_00365 [Ignavibacteriales bacterium]|nr:hypothetical protein [Ignavibacteriales bacterium]